MLSTSTKIGIIGLGYVGVQLAVAFGQKFHTLGFDPDQSKVESYRAGIDQTGEVTTNQFRAADKVTYSADNKDLIGCDIYIVAVPTPVDHLDQPDFEPLLKASKTVGQVMSSGATVIYESTVYPGATEEICVPVLEQVSGLKWRQEFHVGYSPERINPGDLLHTLQRVTKVVAGDDKEALDRISSLYASIVPAGVYEVSSIRVAEAAKVIENTQRDLNIALVNEFAMIFDRLGLDTTEVLEAAGSKWNFLPFTPGLVGGHCIGVDPYYLTHKAQMIGYEPQVILAGRRINDTMSIFVAEKILELLGKATRGATLSVNVLGVTFKENCSDTRNSQVFALVKHLVDHDVKVRVADPLADPIIVSRDHGIDLLPVDELPESTVLVIAVPHKAFGPGQNLVDKILERSGILVDVKAAYRHILSCRSDLTYWSL
ncbi:MAG TPA: nucleotide sugar dehydrogenase [Gammaproteobacteria bacterium]|nr:nucleotide sugar dehydrogenase [Gammaproteobacteria bacterium]